MLDLNGLIKHFEPQQIMLLYSNCVIIRCVIIGPVKQKCQPKIAIIFLSISLNMCFGCSKEPSH